MPNRSRMAVIAVTIATLSATTALRAGETPISNKVVLNLQLAVQGSEGCEVEIKPGHGECKFAKVVKKLEAGTGPMIRLEVPIEAETTHADRDCSFAITVKEPGLPSRTYRRGVRLRTAGVDRPLPVQTFSYAFSNTAPDLKATKNDPAGKTIRR